MCVTAQTNGTKEEEDRNNDSEECDKKEMNVLTKSLTLYKTLCYIQGVFMILTVISYLAFCGCLK